MSCRWLHGVRITGLNGLERSHIGLQHFQMWESKESYGTVGGGLNLFLSGEGSEDLRSPRKRLSDKACLFE